MDVKKLIVFTTLTVLTIGNASTFCVKMRAIVSIVDVMERVLFGTDRRPVVVNKASKTMDVSFASIWMSADYTHVITQPFATTLQEVSAVSVPTIWLAMHTHIRDVMSRTSAIMVTPIVPIRPLVFLLPEFPNVEIDVMTRLFVV